MPSGKAPPTGGRLSKCQRAAESPNSVAASNDQIGRTPATRATISAVEPTAPHSGAPIDFP